MAGRLLSFSQYIGGANNVVVSEVFPSDQKTFQYDYAANIANYNFNLESQTVIVDTLSYDTNTGQPNFSNSKVIGSFAKIEMADFASGAYVPSVVNASAGTVRVYHPDAMYTGPIVPDARVNVPITVVAFTWTDDNSPVSNVATHRYALINCWEPDVTIGDPTDDAGYTALSL